MEAENALDLLTKANEGLRVDSEKWLESKDRQWVELMQEWAGHHVSFHRKVRTCVPIVLMACDGWTPGGVG